MIPIQSEDLTIHGLTFKGKIAQFMRDSTREISIEGGFRAGKTAAALWKVRQSLQQNPGIKWFLCRYSQTDTDSKLRPAIDAWWSRYDPDDMPIWNSTQQCYECSNGSIAIVYGLKGVGALSRYSKLRGMGADTGVASVMVDEAQELPEDIGRELRGRMSQKGFPQQLFFVSNPLNINEWIAKQFPPDNKISGRHYYAIPLSDNAHNLDQEFIDGLVACYPSGHSKHASVILGERGLNVIGTPVYEGVFDRALHVRKVAYDPDRLLLEAFDFGQHNVCWVAAQRLYAGGLVFLGGVFGQDLFLEDFLPTVLEHRAKWFPQLQPRGVRTCCPPPGALVPSRGNRYTNVSVLRGAGFMPIYNDHSNSPDVVAAMIERLASYMMRRTATKEEALGVSIAPERWWRASREGLQPFPFLAHAFESAYVWDPHMVSVGNNRVRQPKDDDWFAHGMRAAQNIELNFCVDQPSDRDIAARRQKQFGAMAEVSEFTKSALQRIGF